MEPTTICANLALCVFFLVVCDVAPLTNEEKQFSPEEDDFLDARTFGHTYILVYSRYWRYLERQCKLLREEKTGGFETERRAYDLIQRAKERGRPIDEVTMATLMVDSDLLEPKLIDRQESFRVLLSPGVSPRASGSAGGVAEVDPGADIGDATKACSGAGGTDCSNAGGNVDRIVTLGTLFCREDASLKRNNQQPGCLGLTRVFSKKGLKIGKK